MSPPDVTDIADDIYADLGPLPDEDEANDWALLHLVDAPTDIYADVAALQGATVPWSPLFDPDTAPAAALPWLAQFVGARLTPGMTVAEQRLTIKERSSWKRGTPAALLSAVRATLTGTKRVTLVERWDGNAYQLAVWTYETETPSPAATEAAVLSQKPAGLALQGDIVNHGLTWYDLAHEHTTWADVATAYATWADVAADVPSYDQGF